MKHNGDINIELIEKGSKNRVYNRLLIPGGSSGMCSSIVGGSGISSFGNNLDLDNSGSNASSTSGAVSNIIITTSGLKQIPTSSMPVPSFTYQCHMCNYEVDNSTSFLEHLQTHNNQVDVAAHQQQPQTDKINSTSTEASIQKPQQNQLIQLLNQKPIRFNCDQCAFVSPCKAQLDTHYGTAHELKTIAAPEIDESLAIDLRTNDVICISDKELIMFCRYCPARFTLEKDLKIHCKMHASWFPYRCTACTYTSRQEPYIEVHANVHSKDYQKKTETMLNEFSVHQDYKQPHLTKVPANETQEHEIWIVSEFSKGLSSSHNKSHEIDNKDLDLDDVISASKVSKVPTNSTDSVVSSSQIPSTENGHEAKEQMLQEQISIQLLAQKQPLQQPQQMQPLQQSPQKQPLQQSPQKHLLKQSSQKSEENKPSTSSGGHKTSSREQTTIEKQIRKIQELRSKLSQSSSSSSSSSQPTNQNINALTKERENEKCPHCPFCTSKPEVLKEHMQCHICVSGNENLINCDHCDYSVADERILKDHIRLHFSSVYSFDRHTESESIIDIPPASSSPPSSTSIKNRKNVAFFTSYDNLILSSISASASISNSSSSVVGENNNFTMDNNKDGNLSKIIYPILVDGDQHENSSDKENKILVDINTGEVIKTI